MSVIVWLIWTGLVSCVFSIHLWFCVEYKLLGHEGMPNSNTCSTAWRNAPTICILLVNTKTKPIMASTLPQLLFLLLIFFCPLLETNVCWCYDWGAILLLSKGKIVYLFLSLFCFFFFFFSSYANREHCDALKDLDGTLLLVVRGWMQRVERFPG